MISNLIKNKTAKEKANIKGLEIAKIKSIAKVKRFDYFEGYIEIISMNPIKGGVELFVRTWDKNNKRIGFGKDGTVDIERFWITNPPILVDDSNGDIMRTWIDSDTQETKTRKLREDLQEALLQSLSHTILVSSQKHDGSKIIEGKVGNSHGAVYPQAGTGTAPIDGGIARLGIDETFATIISSAGTQVSLTAINVKAVLLVSTATSNQYSGNRRAGFGFDTSNVGSDNVDSVIFSLVFTSRATQLGDPDVDIVDFTPADGSNFVTSDYGNFDNVRFATGKAISSLNVGGTVYNDWTLNELGRVEINKSGNTFYGTAHSWDTDSTFGGIWGNTLQTSTEARTADEAGTTKDPKLLVEHSSATFPRSPGVMFSGGLSIN